MVIDIKINDRYRLHQTINWLLSKKETYGGKFKQT